MTQPVVENVDYWDEDTGQTLEFLTAQVREALPPGYCIHGEPFCLSCGLEWLVARSTPTALLSVDSPQGDREPPAAR